ncbi:unnamed protein product [Ilex paraguariensis]|uniref:Uncharacterized protein n=1 Tax=Ilex paraguariensis TaxID=185542 RepID=A0ABC8SPR6_9AQUA
MAMEVVPSRTRILLFLVTFMIITTILLLSISNSKTTTTSSGKEGKTRKQEEDKNRESFIVRCLRRHFGPLPPPPKDEIRRTLAIMDPILCRETIRGIGFGIGASGKIPHYLIEALKKLPQFKNNETALNTVLSKILSSYYHHRIAEPPIIRPLSS